MTSSQSRTTPCAFTFSSGARNIISLLIFFLDHIEYFYIHIKVLCYFCVLFKCYHIVCIWFSSLSLVLRYRPLLLSAIQYSIVWKHHIFFILFCPDRNLQIFTERELILREVTGLAQVCFSIAGTRIHILDKR